MCWSPRRFFFAAALLVFACNDDVRLSATVRSLDGDHALDFAEVYLTRVSSRTLELYADGNDAVTLTLDAPLPEGIEGPAEITVAAGEKQRVTFFWSPSEAGILNQTLSYQTDRSEENKGPWLVELLGTAIEVPSCDDGNPCTQDSFSFEHEQCEHQNLSAEPCDDGSACTLNDVCFEGQCLGEVQSCNDDIPCTLDVCDPQSGCVYVPNERYCEDGDPCTADVCDVRDGCQNPVEDDWTPCGDFGCATGHLCFSGSCDEVDITAFSNGYPCDNGNDCTIDDVCESGECIAGPDRGPEVVDTIPYFGNADAEVVTDGTIFLFTDPNGLRVVKRDHSKAPEQSLELLSVLPYKVTGSPRLVNGSLFLAATQENTALLIDPYAVGGPQVLWESTLPEVAPPDFVEGEVEEIRYGRVQVARGGVVSRGRARLVGEDYFYQEWLVYQPLSLAGILGTPITLDVQSGGALLARGDFIVFDDGSYLGFVKIRSDGTLSQPRIREGEDLKDTGCDGAGGELHLDGDRLINMSRENLPGDRHNLCIWEMDENEGLILKSVLPSDRHYHGVFDVLGDTLLISGYEFSWSGNGEFFEVRHENLDALIAGDRPYSWKNSLPFTPLHSQKISHDNQHFFISVPSGVLVFAQNEEGWERLSGPFHSAPTQVTQTLAEGMHLLSNDLSAGYVDLESHAAYSWQSWEKSPRVSTVIKAEGASVHERTLGRKPAEEFLLVSENEPSSEEESTPTLTVSPYILDDVPSSDESEGDSRHYQTVAQEGRVFVFESHNYTPSARIFDTRSFPINQETAVFDGTSFFAGTLAPSTDLQSMVFYNQYAESIELSASRFDIESRELSPIVEFFTSAQVLGQRWGYGIYYKEGIVTKRAILVNEQFFVANAEGIAKFPWDESGDGLIEATDLLVYEDIAGPGDYGIVYADQNRLFVNQTDEERWNDNPSYSLTELRYGNDVLQSRGTLPLNGLIAEIFPLDNGHLAALTQSGVAIINPSCQDAVLP